MTSPRLLPLALAVIAACGGSSTVDQSGTHQTSLSYSGELSYEIIAEFPHDPLAFTQGLEFGDGVIYESTGQYGESDRRLVDTETGEILTLAPLAEDLFAEGITQVGDELIQLTWKNGIAIVSDATTLVEKRRHSFLGEGWGLCLDGDRLVMSDGTGTLRLRDPATFEATGTVTVTRNDRPVELINELECVGGLVFANVWKSAEIIVIDPDSGTVTGSINLVELIPDEVADSSKAVLNGIAYRAETGTFFVTGKNWDTMYELRLNGS